MDFVKPFSKCSPDSALLGGKGSNIIYLLKNKYNVPPGFIITTKAHKYFIENSKHSNTLFELLSRNNSPNEVISLSKNIKKKILESDFPIEIRNEIETAYKKFNETNDNNLGFAVRSSATVEDSKTSSFAGQADTFLFRKTIDQIIESVKDCWISLYSPSALLYMIKMNNLGKYISLEDIHMAIVIQKMIHSEISGVLFTANVLNNNYNQILINSIWGLGEALANNIVNPDTIVIDKTSCKIIRKIIGKKEKKIIPDLKNACTKITHTGSKLSNKLCLNEKHIKKLYDVALKIEEIFNTPQDVEWTFKDDTLFILQSRPITTLP